MEPIPSPLADEADPTAILEFDAPSPPPRRRRTLPLAAIAAVAVAATAAGLAAWGIHRSRAADEALRRADALVRLDTAAALRDAAALLAPLAERDPVEAGSLRAFALALLVSEHGELDAAADAERLLVAPGREAEVPPRAELAAAALALARREAGTATTAAAHAGATAWADVLHARIALLAGSLGAAVESAAAAATADPGLPAARAVEGDAARLAGQPRAAQAAYVAALTASPAHPRAAFGLAKLALSGHAPAADARAALKRLLDDRGATAPQRARAALHLAAMRLRAGDRAGAAAALDEAGLAGADRTWAERAAAIEAGRRPYRAVAGAPAALQTPADEG